MKKKNLICELSLQDLKNQWDLQKGICPYTGYQMILSKSHNKLPLNASLDRIDSSKPYTKDNVEFICLAVNYAKSAFSKKQMLDFFN